MNPELDNKEKDRAQKPLAAEGYEHLRERLGHRKFIHPEQQIITERETTKAQEELHQQAADSASLPDFLREAEQKRRQKSGPQNRASETNDTNTEQKDDKQKVELVAELSANHRQDMDLALQTLRAMAEAGADAIKLQSYDAQSLTLPLQQAPFIIENSVANPSPWDGQSLYSLYEEAAMPWAWHKPLYTLAASLGLPIFSTPFCLSGVDFLEQLETPRYKIASFEIGHLELVRRVAATGKPIIASLGIASFADIERFLDACAAEGNSDITLLQCTSAYPASPAKANLSMLPHLQATFGCRVGLSDHTMGWTVAVAAVALGAQLIEKHFILSRGLGGPDASFSMEPTEFAAMVREVRVAEAALGQVDYRLSDAKQAARRFGRAIFALRDLREGETLQREDLAVLRPCPTETIPVWELEKLPGCRLRCAVSYGTALEWHMLLRG